MPDECDDLLKPTTFKEKLKYHTTDIVVFLMMLALGVVIYKHNKEEREKQSVAPVSIENVSSVNAAKKQTMNAIRFNMNNRAR